LLVKTDADQDQTESYMVVKFFLQKTFWVFSKK